ncbi:hypothetical protein [Photobacterium damselae]|uniref:hypothetical protein n=1 Tax=Photobacterium damselae TaxID=38293 RepID=UPI00083AB000|nr:hypothetical protein [Photobacterium damselae]ODA24051.1 hypothetical protein A0J46_05710 [Photobacterium damselae subsp. damselae]
MIKHITLALGTGFVGSVANAIAIYLINPLQGLPSPDHIFIYKQVFWGGLWALLYLLPWFKQTWYIKGTLAGLLASLCTFFVFQSIPITAINLIKAFVVNVVLWGWISAYLYAKTIITIQHHDS